MSKEYKTITQNISKVLADFRKEIPDTMQAFAALGQAAKKGDALNEKTKELIAIALSVAEHCDGCIGFHTQNLIRLNVTRKELLETLNMAVYMGGGPSLMYAAEAVRAFEEFSGN